MTTPQTGFMQAAIDAARESVAKGGFPSGAVIVRDGKIVGRGLSIGNVLHDPTSHGEVAAIRHACTALQTTSLANCELYTALEPCLMCLGAAKWSGIEKIRYACSHTRVSPEYYAGHYKTDDINRQLVPPLDIAPMPEWEDAALDVVRDWKKSLG